MALFGFDLSAVPDIDFCVKDASAIESDVIVNYENQFALITQQYKTLARGDPVRLLLLSQIMQIVIQRSIVDSTGKENLIKYSHGNNLINIGALYGERCLPIPTKKATTTLRFSLSTGITLTTDSPIPIGTIAQTNSQVQFVTTQAGTILAGSSYCDVPAEAANPGTVANGFVAGQINQLVAWSAPFLVFVTNTTTSTGGTDEEGDDHLRARIWMAPESFSVAGPKEAYEYWAATADPGIIDVSVWSDPSVAGQVYVYPLMTGGQMPSQTVIDAVYAICNADDIRPLTDQLFVQAPTAVNFTATVDIWIASEQGQFESQILSACQTAFANWQTWQSSEIGLDINPSKLDQMLVDAGAKRTVIHSPVFTVVDDRSLAVCNTSASALTYQGLENK